MLLHSSIITSVLDTSPDPAHEAGRNSGNLMKAPSTKALALTTLLMLAGASNVASGQMTAGDLFAPGDRLLVTDHMTGLAWLTPTYTKSHSYNDTFVQGIIASNGFRYATLAEVTDMMRTNFDNDATPDLLDMSGTEADAFFNLFGANASVDFGDGGFSRSIRGFTGTPYVLGLHWDFGVSQSHYSVAAWADFVQDGSVAYVRGSWLVREDPAAMTTVPEPSTALLACCGLAALLPLSRRKYRTRK